MSADLLCIYQDAVVKKFACLIYILFVFLPALISCSNSSDGNNNTSPSFSVTYDGNGNTSGNVPVDNGSYEQGFNVTVLGNTGGMSLTGYTFVGWNTQADGGGDTYVQAQTFSMPSSNVTLYAQWTLNPTYTVTYDGNGNTGGSVPIDNSNYQQNQTVTVLGNPGNLIRAGYSFSGWNTQTNGSGTTYTASQTFSIGGANVTLYALWTANPTYTVTYNGNGNTGGVVPVDNTNYQQGQTVTVLGNTGNLVLSGSTFSGWNTQSDGGGNLYSAAETFPMGNANVTLYATWQNSAICGDGKVEVPEACDDGNSSACGTCSAACDAVQIGNASGDISTVAGSLLVDGETFTIDDGFNPPETFEFDQNGNGVTAGNVAVNTNSGMSAFNVRDAIIAAINSTSLYVAASSGGSSTVVLYHDFVTSLGNQRVTESVSALGFSVSGLIGGKGGDCPVNESCSVDEDCASQSCVGFVCM